KKAIRPRFLRPAAPSRSRSSPSPGSDVSAANPPDMGQAHSGPSIWCIADGRAGIVNQTLALKAALEEPDRRAKLAHIRSMAHRDTPLILQPQGWQLMLRPDLWPSPLSALPAEQRSQLKPPWPDVWIAAGRRSIPYSRMMRKLS